MDLLCHELLKAQKTQHICAGNAKKWAWMLSIHRREETIRCLQEIKQLSDVSPGGTDTVDLAAGLTNYQLRKSAAFIIFLETRKCQISRIFQFCSHQSFCNIISENPRITIAVICGQIGPHMRVGSIGL